MTHDWIALQKLAHDEFTARVDRITEWDRATPDPDWTVRDLVRHLVLEQQWIPPLLGGLSPLEARRALTPLGAAHPLGGRDRRVAGDAVGRPGDAVV